jgi:hypothetical protein
MRERRRGYRHSASQTRMDALMAHPGYNFGVSYSEIVSYAAVIRPTVGFLAQ